MNLFRLTIGITFVVAAIYLPQVSESRAQQTSERGQEQQAEPQPLSVWMQKKTEYAQAMLHGLVQGDLDSVAEKAEQMRIVSKVEGWIRGKKTGYRAHLQVFEFANSEIQRHARAGNLEGTTMAFHQLTTACVSCHKMIRNPNGKSKPATSSAELKP